MFIFEIFFGLMFIIGAGILVIGVLMSLFGVGTSAEIYIFFNDNPWGWAIMFGLMAVGAIGFFIVLSLEKAITKRKKKKYYITSSSRTRTQTREDIAKKETTSHKEEPKEKEKS